jgi:hypothetical protein
MCTISPAGVLRRDYYDNENRHIEKKSSCENETTEKKSK